jgi:S1-C subfamily serine protease
MRIDRTSRLVFAMTSAVAGSLIFCLTIAAALAAPAEPSPPPVTPTPEAKPSPVVVLSAPAATPSKAVENSVVKIFATLRQPDPTKPWTKKEPSDITASGAVISGKRILTNAHVVQYASEVQVQATQAGTSFPRS